MLNKTPEIVAAVDLGSNSFHMIVCSLKDGKLQTIDRLKETVRLANGLDKDNMLDSDTQNRALACLEKFGQRIRHFPLGTVRIVGTNTLRTATNAQAFLTQAEQVLNHPIHIISGIEEARLIYLGVAYSLGNQAQLRLVMDIGGGSTEYIIGTGETPREKESLHMGCVTVSNRFFKDGIISKSAFAQAVLFAQQQLEPFQTKFQRKNWEQAIGASGSLRSIAKVLQAKNWSNNGITRAGLELLVARIQQCSHINELLSLPELDADRLPVFAGGVAIVYATFNSLGIEQMTVADGALREGLIQDLLGRLDNHDVRASTVQNLANRYRTDERHATRIKQTINTMLAQLNKKCSWASNKNGVQFLQWAADLHEIGIDIAHSQYHKHSAYVIENGDLAGFSRQDQQILATIVRSQRRKFSPALFMDLPELWSTEAVSLTLILRLAILLHRNRADQTLPSFKITMSKVKISLKFATGWLAQSPLTHADLTQEAEYLKAAGYKLEFC
ncbi:MAG: exopolyphosphatase [Methylococcales bacterium]|nr:exopolyphosphatase [Methylococcales bacterium]